MKFQSITNEKEKKMNKFMLNAALSFAALSANAETNAEMEKLALEHECTSWMVFSDLTKNNTNILHKNRDASSENISVMISPAGAKRKWIFLGSNSANSGMNSSGLASVVNSGELCPDPAEDKTKKTTPALVRDVLENCDTAAQAVERLRTLVTAGDYNHGKKGSIFFFMDTKEAYICELTIKVFTAQRYDRGYAVRANIWQNPGMQAHSRNTIKGYLNSSARAYIAYSGLNKALEKNGRISVQDIMELSRHCVMPEESPEKRSVCFKRTNSASSLEIDLHYPDVLSTGYFTIGHPRHTVYIPVPICTEKILPAMGDFSWGKASFKRLNQLGLTAPIPAAWLDFEKNSMAKYAAAKDAARKLLEQGKRAEAVKLLNDTAFSIWTEAETLLNIK